MAPSAIPRTSVCSVQPFKAALAFAVQAGCAAERLDHHPDLLVRWGSVTVTTWIHDVEALTRLELALADALDNI